MNAEGWHQIEDIFEQALQCEGESREVYLRQACALDEALYLEIKGLLDAYENSGSFLSEPDFQLGLTVLSDVPFARHAGSSFAHYSIRRLIGQGGMGDVYLAYDSKLGRRVALKLLPQHLTSDPERLHRFEQEARAASLITHANVAQVYEVGKEEGLCFIALEYVDGLTLRERLCQPHLALDEAMGIAEQVAAALTAAHAAGVIHRDLKPENIMIRGDGQVKVLDFSLAKLTKYLPPLNSSTARETSAGTRFTNPINTEPGTIMGTPTYMSPEQARGFEVDARTDIWSWGIVVYEMLLGQPPFRGQTSSDIIAEILKSDPPFPVPVFPTSLLPILHRSLSKTRNERYATSRELLQEFREFRQSLNHDRSGLLNPSGQRDPASQEIMRPEGLLQTEVTATSQPTETKLSAMASSKTGQSKLTKRSMLLISTGLLLMLVLAPFIDNLARRLSFRTGTSARPQITYLTNDGRVMDAALSGDGQLMAYVTIESGKQSLWVRNLQSGEEWQLLPPAARLYWGLRFMPDRQNLLYLATEQNNAASVLYRIPVQGGVPADKLLSNIHAPPAISPDGRQIAFIRSSPAERRDVLMVANADGSTEQEIISRQHPESFSLSGFSWSPDCKLITFGAGRNNDTEYALMSIPISGGTAFTLTPWRWAAIEGIAWDDGNRLLFSARELGTKVLQIWRLSASSGEIEHITDDENAYEEVTLSSQGNTLITTRTYEVSDLWAVDLSAAPRRLTTQGHAGADGLAVTNGRVIYTVGEYEQSTLWTMKLDGRDRKPLTDQIGFLPSASRDGRFIAYVSIDQGVHHIWLRDSEGRNPKQLTAGRGESAPSLSPDGKWVVYTSLLSERNNLWKISTQGGKSVQLASEFIVRRPVVSPDGTMIACVYQVNGTDEWRVAILPFNGGAPLQTLALPLARHQMLRWSPDSQALIYLHKQNGVHNLWKQPLNLSSPSPITNFTEDSILHYDGLRTENELVLARGGRRRDITLIKNFK